MIRIPSIVFLILTMNMATSHAVDTYETVLTMKPVGYWPADEGKATVLHDRSGHGNNGVIRRVSWDKKKRLLDFTGAYQYLEIPNRPNYQTKDFSIGGWVFIRDKVTGGPFGFKEGMTFIGSAYGGSGYSLDTLYDEPVLIDKSKLFGGGVPYDHRKNGVSLCIRRDELVDIISGGKDALGSRADKVGVALGQWQHVLYTYRADRLPLKGGEDWKGLLDTNEYRANTGTGTLYINGQKVQEKGGVPFSPRHKSFLVGSDAVWWLQASAGSGSLNGSVCDIVMFDRALKPAEIQTLSAKTRPTEEPATIAEAVIETNDLSDKGVAELIAVLQDKNKSQAERAKAVLALAARKGKATSAVPVLAATLRDCLDGQEPRLPRVEELLRNAVTRALLDIAAKDPVVKELLQRALPAPAKKIIEYTDPETGREYQFVCTVDHIEPGLVAWLYLLRWRIEKSFDNLKNNFFEQKAWATGQNALTIQSSVIAMVYNFMRFIKEFLHSEKGIVDKKVDRKYANALEQREKKATKKGRFIHPFMKKLTRMPKLSAQFIRSIKNHFYQHIRFCDLIPAFKRSMIFYL